MGNICCKRQTAKKESVSKQEKLNFEFTTCQPCNLNQIYEPYNDNIKSKLL